MCDFGAKIWTTGHIGSYRIISYSRCHLRVSAGPSIIKPIRRFARTLAWNRSKMRRVGAAKSIHAQTLPSMYTLERPSFCVSSQLRRNYAVLLMNAEILPRGLAFPSPVVDRLFTSVSMFPSLAIFPLWRRLI